MSLLAKLNRRHKAILFLTLVTSGTATVAGGLHAGMGVALLGMALGWAVGSDNRTAHWFFVVAGLLLAAAPCLMVWNELRRETNSQQRQVAEFERSLPSLARRYPLVIKNTATPSNETRDGDQGVYLAQIDDGWIPITQQEEERLSKLSAAFTKSDMVRMRAVDGRLWDVPKENVVKAEALGAKVAEKTPGPLALAPNTRRWKDGRWVPMPSWYWDALAAGVDIGDVPDYLKPSVAPGTFSSRFELAAMVPFAFGTSLIALGLALLLAIKPKGQPHV